MRVRRLTAWLLVAVIGLLAGATLLTLPDRPRPTAGDPGPGSVGVPGAYHVHSDRSDGTGSIEDIARAASQAGLGFVIVTDHGDGTRQPDPPRYVDGVLLIDAVEISTAGGHYVALGLDRAPFRLAGEPRDVVEDVRRLGGFGVVAHPGSLKPELSWQAWRAPYDGIEWLNADSEWRDEPLRRILWSLWHYPFRRSESLAAILDRPDSVLARWDRALENRPVVSLAAVDAHARLGRLGNLSTHEAAGRSLVAVPSYEASFRTFSIRVHPVSALSGSAGPDADALISAIRAGRVHSVVDSIARPGRFEFTARSGAARAEMGGRLLLDGPLELNVVADLPEGARIVMLRNGEAIRTGGKSSVVRTDRRRGVYRVEVHVPGAPGTPPVPWILSNAIVADDSTERPEIARPEAERGAAPLRLTSAAVEHDPSSSIEMARESIDKVQIARLAYRLGGGPRQNQYAAMVIPRNDIPARFNQLSFEGSSDMPMRVSVQLRSEVGERWQRSVYLSPDPATIRIGFNDVATADLSARIERPALDRIRAILFVVDTVNTLPGASGTFTVAGLRFSR